MKHIILVLATTMALSGMAQLLAHCEVPCGIYNDKVRIVLIKEHITTIEKAMNQINALAEADDENYNQIVRWTLNKEKHAEELQHIVMQYFMTQRIKLVDGSDMAATKAYQNKVGLLHSMLVYAMKAKQTTDQTHIDTLRAAVDNFVKAYFNEEDQKHLMDHHG